ncbi:MAG: DUF6119 family protein [Verrucomicrobiota bacterium]
METYNLLLLKDNIQSETEAIDQDKQPEGFPLSEDFTISGTLFLGAQNRSIPKWAAMMNPHLTQPLGNIYSASISAVLILSFQARFFALTFGHGKSLLQPNSWVRDFGLKVTLNRVDPEKLRSIDSKVYDDLVITTRQQTSRSSILSSFELDVGRALVRGVTGDAESSDQVSRLTGSESLRVTTSIEFNQISQLLQMALEAYHDDTYRDQFSWIDNIREVDPDLTERMDGLLVESLEQGRDTDAYLAPAEIINWENVRGFNYTHGSKNITYPELEIGQYLEILREKNKELTIDRIKTNRVKLRMDDSEELRDEWPVYNCIVWETTLDDSRYVLFEGRWFEIDSDYAHTVEDFEQSITGDELVISDLGGDRHEEDFINQLSVDQPGVYAVLDQQTVLPSGASSRVEFCDLLSSDYTLLHLKKRTSSATLSHLFAQGSVSADLFLQDPGLREQVRDKLEEIGSPNHCPLIPEDRPNSSDYEVVYGIITKHVRGAWPPALPFFSAVNLMTHARRIQALGFNVSLRYIRQAN